MQLDKIHATVVTGFLGSGKTTLLSNLIKNATNKRIAVVVNEFGEMDIDAELLRGCPLACDDDATETEDGIFELANGCICCTVEEEFVPVMKKLIEKRDSIDHIVIETSGLALPKPLVQAFNWPEIKRHCTVDSVIAVLDGPAIAAGTKRVYWTRPMTEARKCRPSTMTSARNCSIGSWTAQRRAIRRGTTWPIRRPLWAEA